MIIDSINLNLLRVFESVYRLGSMTDAAKELHMTQSGVSQHIKTLEQFLEVQLFDRIKHKPLPTPKAKILFDQSATQLYLLEGTLAQIKGVSLELDGEITLGLPLEFGNNIVLPLLVEFGKLHPAVSFKIIYGHASDLSASLQNGSIDFAIVDSFNFDSSVESQQIHDEVLHLCCSEEYYNTLDTSTLNRKFFESLDFIDYVKDGSVLKMWLKHHYHFTSNNLNVRASLMNVQGVIKMISQGLGAGIVPLYILERLAAQGKVLHRFDEKIEPLKNTLSISFVHNRTLSRAAVDCKDYLLQKICLTGGVQLLQH
jgi:DNA-binding transcriptional LysR family regulator